MSELDATFDNKEFLEYLISNSSKEDCMKMLISLSSSLTKKDIISVDIEQEGETVYLYCHSLNDITKITLTLNISNE